MKNVLAAIACFLFTVFTVALAAPSVRAQKTKAVSHTQPVTTTTPAPSPALSSALADLDRVASATQADLDDLGKEKSSDDSWKNAWHFWRFRSSHKRPPTKAVLSLQHNLHDAMPGLIQDARSTASFAATFKLYNNLSVVCELLDSVVDAGRRDGSKDGALSNDAAAMGRIRQDLATYVEQSAAALDARTTIPASTASTGRPVKKIVVDDTIPEKKAKKAAARQ
jgi:hypothetical protein